MKKPNGFPGTILGVMLSILMSNFASAQTPPCNTNAPVSYTITPTSSGEIWIPDASTKPWKGGDTLKIPAGNYSLIELSNFSGDPCKPIVITNSGGLVSTANWRMRNNTRYFKVTGTGKPGLEYGIKINGGMMAISLAHHFEVDHVEATGGSLGFYFKTVPTTADPRTIYTAGSSTNYVMTDVKIHHNYLHDIAGEGMYIGHTGPSGNQEGTGLIPLRMDNVEISYNTVANVDWDGIQLSNARNSKIHNNTVWNFGRINKGSQQAGIIMGGNTTGDIYNNRISKGTGNGLEAFGYGTIRIYNNYIDSTGWDGTSNGQESVYSTDAPTSPEVNPKQEIRFYNNVVNNPKPKGGIRVGAYSNYSLPSTITDNQFCIPNAASNWITFYVVSHVAGSTITNNVLSCTGSVPVSNQLPVANAGPDQSVTLPTTTATLSGSGTDPDGSVASYQWTKVSGPSIGTISNPASAVTGLVSLTEGTYKFELKVTDNSGAASKDTVQLIVNPALVVPTPTPAEGVWINVNIHGGTAFTDTRWNNWNTNLSLSAGSLKTEAGAATTVSVALNSQSMIVDNGNNYASASVTPPSAVLRFNSASTSTRVMTLSGLKSSSKYTLYVYGSRKSTGNKTIIEIGSLKDTINTDNNVTDYAKFLHLTPDNTGKIAVTISRVGTWNYISGFSLQEEGTEVAAATISANAGSDKVVTLPANSVTLSGTVNVTGTTLSSYSWTKVSGPAAVISGANTATATISSLVEGTYVFQLTGTAATGITSSDNVQVVVETGTQPASGRNIRVNVFNGTVSYNPTIWNNWNTNAGLTTSYLKYEDGSVSTVRVNLAGQASIVDNGSGYATSSTLPPYEVLRFNSSSTSTRLITITGLNPSGVYGFEFYGSRKTSGNKSVFTIGNSKDTISTDNNVNDYARFSNIVADNTGKVVIELSRIGTYNYLAGLTIMEQGGLISRDGSTENAIMGTASTQQVTTDISTSLNVYPNPFVNTLNIDLGSEISGKYTINVLDVSGKQLITREGSKDESKKTESLNVSSLSFGYYFVQVISSSGQASIKVKKIGASQY